MKDLNKFIIPEYFSHDINLRAKVDTGTKCNYKCSFCYYLKDLNSEEKDINIIKKEIDSFYNRGATSFDLSGGESSIHSKFFEIIKYCKQYGDVSMLSNGSRLYDYNFINTAYELGLNEIMFSLHGHDEKSHDKIVKYKNAFKHIMESIQNCLTLGIKFRINCTVDESFNVEKYLKLMNQIQPSQINFLPINYWNDANDLEIIDYKMISDKLKFFIDHYKVNIEINIRYIPFCFMKGYEKYVVGIYQHIYDKGDWNIQLYENLNTDKISVDKMFNLAHIDRCNSYIKPLECLQCKYKIICDGIEKQNINNILEPINDETIKDINYYRN